MTKGIAAFIETKKNNSIIGVIDSNNILKMSKIANGIKVFKFFGCEDTVFNHLHLLLEVRKGRSTEIQKKGKHALNLRQYTVECISQGEYLVLSVQTLDKMKKNF
jgi:hypothetical protein